MRFLTRFYALTETLVTQSVSGGRERVQFPDLPRVQDGDWNAQAPESFGRLFQRQGSIEHPFDLDSS